MINFEISINFCIFAMLKTEAKTFQQISSLKEEMAGFSSIE